MDVQHIFRDRVRERDLDNFLVEELRASVPFLHWFLSRLPASFQPPLEGSVRLHKSPTRAQDARQTDVRLGWFARDDLRACVLIESKVTADFEPGQAEAYVQEVNVLQRKLGESSVASVLVAPTHKMNLLRDASLFSARITIEDMAASLADRRLGGHLDPELDGRLAARIELLEALAGKRLSSLWVPTTVESKRTFALAYSDLAKSIVPHLMVRPSNDGPKAITRFFDGLRVPPDFPCPVSLKHEFGAVPGMKYVNLQFAGAASGYSSLKAVPKLFDSGMQPVVSGKSLFIRIETPSVCPNPNEFDAQRDNVVVGLRAIGRLSDWFERNCELLAGGLLNESGLAKDDLSEHKLDLLLAFDRALRELAEQAWKEIRYRPLSFLQMLEKLGGEGTAHALLAGQPQEGFQKLWRAKRLDLSLEALVVQEPWRPLFSERELRTAARRLSDAGYRPRLV